MMKQLGRHVIAELTGCDPIKLNDHATIESALKEAAISAVATLLSVHVHAFHPQGMTGVALLSESHISIHTWPELGYAAVDVFTCGDGTKPLASIWTLRTLLGATSMKSSEFARGLPKGS